MVLLYSLFGESKALLRAAPSVIAHRLCNRESCGLCYMKTVRVLAGFAGEVLGLLR